LVNHGFHLVSRLSSQSRFGKSCFLSIAKDYAV
jgi:hypothetical protein